MDEQEVKKTLSGLNFENRQIFYWRCFGITDNETIARKLVIKEGEKRIGGGTVYNRLLWIYGRLDVELVNREDRISEIYLNALGLQPDFSDENWPPEGLRETSGSPDPQPDTSPTSAGPTPSQRTRRPISPLVFIVGGIFLVGAVLFAFTLLGDDPFNVGIRLPTRPTEIVEATNPPEPTDTVEPSATPESPEPTATELVDVAVEPTALPIADIQTNTPSPTDTPAPTDNPTITPTSTPTPLFFDDFTGGKSDLWVVERGEPIVANGAISGTENWTMTIGDGTWTNYEVTFEVTGFNCVTSDFSVGMRVQDVGNMIRLKWCGDTQGWHIHENTQDQIVANTRFNTPQTVKIRVIGNEYSVVGGSSFIDEENRYPRGKVTLFVVRGLVVDNVEIVSLP